jgi:superfamily II DNA helicase RecQ
LRDHHLVQNMADVKAEEQTDALCAPPYREAQQRLLRKYYGFPGLHPEQQDAVDALLNGKNVSVVAPTGFGKSICYILPAITHYFMRVGRDSLVERRAVSIVVSPLLALIYDQVSSLRQRGVPAAMITSSETNTQNGKVIAQLQGDDPLTFALLYVTAERVTSAAFLNILVRLHQRGRLGVIAVDEAHCISEWVRLGLD